MRVDIMVDIETLGTTSDSTIFQIAAIAFDITSGVRLDNFDRIADIEKNDVMTVDGSTIKWWVDTDKELFAELLSRGRSSSDQVLREFHRWLLDFTDDWKPVYLWGNGILFDNKMIQHQFNKLGLHYPIHYKNDRDVRTIVDLACMKSGMKEKELKEGIYKVDLVEHDALDDVVWQIDLVRTCYKILMD